jgi:hypothetical protein
MTRIQGEEAVIEGDLAVAADKRGAAAETGGVDLRIVDGDTGRAGNGDACARPTKSSVPSPERFILTSLMV